MNTYKLTETTMVYEKRKLLKLFYSEERISSFDGNVIIVIKLLQTYLETILIY